MIELRYGRGAGIGLLNMEVSPSFGRAFVNDCGLFELSVWFWGFAFG